MDKGAILKAEEISLSFRENKVLDKLTLELKGGEILGITGVSGAGKSTMLNVLAGLLTPDSGEVYYNGSLMVGKNSAPLELGKHYHLIKSYIGYSTQDPSFYPELSALENLDFFGAMYNVPKRVRHKNAGLLIELMGLEGVAKKPARSLSGGMKKRLDIACALIHNPKVLILDEPTSDLDPILREKMWQLIRQLNSQGTSVIISSHFLNEIEGLCSRIAILHKGRLFKEILQTKQLSDTLLEVIVEPRHYDALIGELLKKHSINPEDMSHDKQSHCLFIRTSHPEKTRHFVAEEAKALNLALKKCDKTTQCLKEIFERTVK
jgi:ABC-2 type transport system ATP-binding protein